MEMQFTEAQTLLSKKSVFLSNPLNKQRFIEKLKEYLQSVGIGVFQSKQDADVMIVEKAVNLMNAESSVVMVGDDTDLLVLALHKLRLVPQYDEKMIFQ